MRRDGRTEQPWPIGGGETGAHIRSLDWSATPLGPIASWPQSLRSTIDLVLASPLAMNLMWGPELVQIYNEANQAFMGSKHPRAFGRPAREHWSEIWDAAERLHRRVFAGETVTLVDHPWTLLRDGAPEETFFTTYMTPIRDETGAVAGHLSTGFETTAAVRERAERRRAERALRESETRLQAAADLLTLGCYSWDPRTDALEWDDTVRAMWGLPPGAPVDHAMWRAGVHPDDLARVEAAIRQCADPRGDGLYDIEYRVIGIADGVERWIETRGQTQFDNDRPVSFYGVALEVTSRKRIESALESRVEARTRDLEEANRQLRSQVEQRQVAEAEVQQLQRLDAIGQITSGVAHDFNNLLSVVLTNARLLSRNVHGPDDQEGLELIAAAAQRGATLIKQLLAFSRKQRLEPQAVDLNGKILAMTDLLRATLGGTVQLETSLASRLWLALVDPTQIELIVLNLAINARDAMQTRGVLTIETFNATIEEDPVKPGDPSSGTYVGLTVSDTGTGIADDILPRVYEPFFTTKELGKGSGLGLAQVFGFAKQSGGGVRIETRLGQGTSVKVFLPRAGFAAEDRDDEPADPTHAPHETRTLKILVVDNDKAVLRSTLRVLDFLGYAPIPAESGDEALQLIATERQIDLVLADFAMPEMNGIEIVRAIHATRPELPIILVTGYGGLDIFKQLGQARVLQKPYTESDLVDEIMEALG